MKKNFFNVASPGDMDQTQIEPNLYLTSVFTGKIFLLQKFQIFFISFFLSLIIINTVEKIIPIFYSFKISIKSPQV